MFHKNSCDVLSGQCDAVACVISVVTNTINHVVIYTSEYIFEISSTGDA